MKIHSHILFWLALIFVAIFVVPLTVTPEQAQNRVFAEQKSAAEIFGTAVANDLTHRANSVHNALFVETGIEGFLGKFYTKEKALTPVAKETQERAGSVVNRYIWSMTTLFYGIVFRVNILFQWLLYVGIFLVAAIVDGTAQRKIKNATAVELSPLKYSLAVHGMIAMLFIPLLYTVVPVHISPWFTPVWSLLVAWPLAKAISNAIGLD